jgi:hypothetical protein
VGGGSNYKIGIPNVSLGKLNVAMIGVLTTPRGGNKRGT